MMMTKIKAYREAVARGESWLANVIMTSHKNPAKKLKGLVNLLRAGHTVSTAQFDMTMLLVDGCVSSWVVLEEWEVRKV